MKSWLLCVWALSAACVGHAQVNALPEHPHVLVYGSATARALPDRFRLSLSVEATDRSAHKARGRAAALFDDVLVQLKQSGVPEAEIEATSLSIESVKRWDDDGEKEIFIGIKVSRDIKVRFDNVSALEEFLSKVETSENLQVTDVTPELSSEPELRTELRTKAILDSQEKARTIAAAYGVDLGSLYSVSDVAPEFRYGIREGSWPVIYRWSGDAEHGRTLDRVEVSGADVRLNAAESFNVGYLSFDAKIYAVFHIAPSREAAQSPPQQ